MKSESTFLGIFLACLGGFFMVCMDATAKYLSADYPAGQIGFARNWTALPFLIGIFYAEFFWRRNQAIKNSRDPLVLSWKIKSWKIALLRGVLIAVAQLCFFLSLAHLPLATVTSIFFVAPAFITILAAVFLNEQVGVWRWSAVVIGFVGVLLINRPGTEVFSIWTVLPVVTAFLYSVSLTIIRKVNPSDSNAMFTFYTVSCSAVVSIIWILFAFETPTTASLPFFVLLGVFGSFGAYALNLGFRIAPASVIAPFEYITLIFAFIIGWVIWRELPDAFMWPGIFLILASGAVIIVRDRINKEAF